MMDRMDCQLFMMAFTSFHYAHYIAPSPSLSRVQFLANTLSYEDQIQLLNYVSCMLYGSYIVCMYIVFFNIDVSIYACM